MLSIAMITTKLQFDGDLVSILRSDSPAQSNFERLETDFHAFSRDEVLLLETEDLAEGSRLDALREIVIELQLVPGIAGVFSIFSFPSPDGQTSFLEARANEPTQLPLKEMWDAFPMSRQILSQDLELTLIVLMPQQGDSSSFAPDLRAEVEEIISEFGEGEFSASFVGLPAAYRDLEASLLTDQTRLMPYSLGVSLIVLLALFRSWRAAVICLLPPLIGAVFLLGGLAAAGIAVTTLLSLVPLLLLVIGVANAMHLYLGILHLRHLSPDAAGRKALTDVGPACILSSLTTAIAFGTFATTGFDGLFTLAVASILGLTVQTLTVLTLTPALAALLARPDDQSGGLPNWLTFCVHPALRLREYRRAIFAVSFIGLVAAVIGHVSVVAGHSLEEHLLEDGTVAVAEERIAGRLAGTGQRFLMIRDPDALVGLSTEDTRTIEEIVTIAHNRAQIDPSESLSRFAAKDFDEEPLPLAARRFLAQDRLSYAVPLPAPLVEDARDSRTTAIEMEERLANAGFAKQVEVSGLSHLAAIEVPRMIEALQAGLVLTVVLITCLIAFLSRSLTFGLAALVVNAIPVLGVEAALWLFDMPLTMTAAVALTIAFGIAVDDSIHMLNRFRIEYAAQPNGALARSLTVASVPIVASTILIVAGLAVTQASLLPSVATFGMIVGLSMIFALLADLFILPAYFPEEGQDPR